MWTLKVDLAEFGGSSDRSDPPGYGPATRLTEVLKRFSRSTHEKHLRTNNKTTKTIKQLYSLKAKKQSQNMQRQVRIHELSFQWPHGEHGV